MGKRNLVAIASDCGEWNISHNTWIHRIVEVGVRPLAKTAITPNQITTARLVTGLSAAGLMAVDAPLWQYTACGIFILSLILDRADGILARITGKTSASGHFYDLVADSLSNSLFFVGIGVGLRNSALGQWAILLGVLAGAAVAAVLWLVMRAEESEGHRAAELGSAAGFDPDDAMLFIPIAILMGWSEQLLIAASIGAPLFAAFFFWRFRRHLKPG